MAANQRPRPARVTPTHSASVRVASRLASLWGPALSAAAFRSGFSAKRSATVAVAATVALLFALRPERQGAAAGGAGSHRVASLLATLTLALWVGVTLAGRGRWFAAMMTRMIQ